MRWIQRLRYWLSRTGERLADIGAALVAPIERLFAWLFSGLLSASERVDAIGAFFSRLGWIVLWPLVAVARLVRRVLPESVVRRLGLPFVWMRMATVRTGFFLMHVAERLNLDGLIFRFIWLTQPLWRPVAAVISFVSAWGVTRNWRQLVRGVPALVLLAPILLLGGKSLLGGGGDLARAYRVAFRTAQESGDGERAALYQRKLAQLEVDTVRTEYEAALQLAEDGDLEAAAERMRLLAPTERPGYAGAHYWLIQQLMAGRLADSPEAAREEAAIHFDHLATLDVAGGSVDLLRALWLAQAGELQEASLLLEPLVPVMPTAAYERMRVSLAMGDREAARRDARAVITHMTELNQRSDALTPVDLQQWLAAEEVLGNYPKMRQLLEQWRELEPEAEAPAKLLGQVYRRLADQELRKPLPDAEVVVEYWLRSAELDDSVESLARFARQLYRRRDEHRLFPSLLEALRASPRTPTQLLTMIGTEAAIEREWADGKKFLEIAVGRDDATPPAWNNYALVSAELPDADLEAALEAVNKALESMPEEARFRETRGQILLKQGRYDAAVEDLSYALNQLPDVPEIHTGLAEAYAALGEEELAELHRERGE